MKSVCAVACPFRGCIEVCSTRLDRKTGEPVFEPGMKHTVHDHREDARVRFVGVEWKTILRHEWRVRKEMPK